jgi:hypothetical protein
MKYNTLQHIYIQRRERGRERTYTTLTGITTYYLNQVNIWEEPKALISRLVSIWASRHSCVMYVDIYVCMVSCDKIIKSNQITCADFTRAPYLKRHSSTFSSLLKRLKNAVPGMVHVVQRFLTSDTSRLI